MPARVAVTVWRNDSTMLFGFGFPMNPGTYQRCTAPINVLTTAVYEAGSAAWTTTLPTGLDGGTLTLSTINSSTATGSFEYRLYPLSGGATGERKAVGTFSVRFDCVADAALGVTHCTR
jgi:hypothetical protein